MTFPLLAALAEQAEHAAGHAAAGEGAHAVAAHGAAAAEAVAHAIHVSWLWLIPLFPLLGAALNTAFGPWLQRRYGKRANHAIAVGVMVASCIVAAAEAAVGLAIVLAIYQTFRTIDVEETDLLRE